MNRTVLYIGVTNNIRKRLEEHKDAANRQNFTAKYNCNVLVYYEEHINIHTAIEREKQLKNWKREWKEELIHTINPLMEDLSIHL